MQTFYCDVVEPALNHLPQEVQARVQSALSENFITSVDDLLDISETRYAHMQIPIGIANRLRRMATQMTTPAHQTRPSLRAVPLDQKGTQTDFEQVKNGACAGDRKGLFGYVRACNDFLDRFAPSLSLSEVPRDRPVSEQDIIRIPVACLRWTHDHVNSKLQFLHGEQGGYSVFRLLDDLLRGSLAPEGIDEPLEVVVFQRGSDIQLYSLSNRRLLPLMMFQATQRDRVIEAKCVIRPMDQRFEAALSTHSNGLSISPSLGESSHLGLPLFDHGRAAMELIEEVSARHPETSTPQHFKLRQSDRAKSECSLTVTEESSSDVRNRQGSRIGVSHILPGLVITPEACNERRWRSLWLFQDGTWGKVALPKFQGEQHLRKSVPNPTNPRHLQSHWELKACVMCVSNCDLVMATSDGVWTLRMKLGKCTSRCIMEHPSPGVISVRSRITPLSQGRFLFLSIPDRPEAHRSYEYEAFILNKSVKSWVFLKLAESLPTACTSTWRYTWRPAARIPNHHPITFIEHAGDYVYIGLAVTFPVNDHIFRLSISTGGLQSFDFKRATPAVDTYLMQQRYRVHWMNVSPGMQENANQGYRSCNVSSNRIVFRLNKCNILHDVPHTMYCICMQSGFLVEYKQDIYTVELVQRNSQQWFHSSDSIGYNCDGRWFQSSEGIKELVVEMLCISSEDHRSHRLGSFLGLPNEDQIWKQSPAKLGLVLLIALTDAVGQESIYTFFFGLLFRLVDGLSEMREDNFQVGWVFDGHTSRQLEDSALELPHGLRNTLVKFAVNAGSGRVALFGGGNIALLVTQNQCATFCTSTERWTTAPLIPSSTDFLRDSIEFLAPNSRRGLVWNLDISTVLGDTSYHADGLQQLLRNSQSEM